MFLPQRFLGSDVAILAPVKAGSTAHRLAYYLADKDGVFSLWHPGKAVSPKPRCYTDEAAAEAGHFAEHSVGWADKLGVTACPVCFVETSPEG
jgi:hypothetical protein